MKTIGSVLVTVGAIVTLALGAPLANAGDPAPGANAPAEGTFLYMHRGQEQRLNNPDNGRCYHIQGDGFTWNNTNRDARLYRGDDCRGDYETLEANGGHERYANFSSVKFQRR